MPWPPVVLPLPLPRQSPEPVPVLPVPVEPLPVLPVFPVVPVLPVFPVVPVPPPPTGAAPPEAEVTGMLVVVVVDFGGAVVVVVVVVLAGADGVVVVVVVGVVGVPVPPVVGTEAPVPTTVRMAVGAEPPLGGDEVAAAMALGSVGVPATEGLGVPLAWLLVPAPEDPAGDAAVAPGAVVGVVVPSPGTVGPPDWADRIDWLMGPAPMLNPATIDSAAAATAPDAMNRLRPKYNFDAVIASGRAGRAGVRGSGRPNERDVNTSSKVA